MRARRDGVGLHLRPDAGSGRIVALEEDVAAVAARAMPDSHKAPGRIRGDGWLFLAAGDGRVDDEIAANGGAGGGEDPPRDPGSVAVARSGAGRGAESEQQVAVRQLRDLGLVLRRTGLLVDLERGPRRSVGGKDAGKDPLPGPVGAVIGPGDHPAARGQTDPGRFGLVDLTCIVDQEFRANRCAIRRMALPEDAIAALAVLSVGRPDDHETAIGQGQDVRLILCAGREGIDLPLASDHAQPAVVFRDIHQRDRAVACRGRVAIEYVQPDVTIFNHAIRGVAIAQRLDQGIDGSFGRGWAEGDAQGLADRAVKRCVDGGEGHALVADSAARHRDLPRAVALVGDEQGFQVTGIAVDHAGGVGHLQTPAGQGGAGIVEIDSRIDDDTRQRLGIGLVEHHLTGDIAKGNDRGRVGIDIHDDRARFRRAAIAVGQHDTQFAFACGRGCGRVRIGQMLDQDAHARRRCVGVEQDVQVGAVYPVAHSVDGADLDPVNRNGIPRHADPAGQIEGQLFKGIGAVVEPGQGQAAAVEIGAVCIRDRNAIVQPTGSACISGCHIETAKIVDPRRKRQVGETGRIAQDSVQDVVVIAGRLGIFFPGRNDRATGQQGQRTVILGPVSGHRHRDRIIHPAAIGGIELDENPGSVAVGAAVVTEQHRKGPACQGQHLGFILVACGHVVDDKGRADLGPRRVEALGNHPDAGTVGRGIVAPGDDEAARAERGHRGRVLRPVILIVDRKLRPDGRTGRSEDARHDPVGKIGVILLPGHHDIAVRQFGDAAVRLGQVARLRHHDLGPDRRTG